MKKAFIIVLTFVTLAVVGISCKKNDPDKGKDKVCVCDVTVTYNNQVVESSKGQSKADCKDGLHSIESVKVKLKTGETVSASEDVKCYMQ